jgi:hypothetical protein
VAGVAANERVVGHQGVAQRGCLGAEVGVQRLAVVGGAWLRNGGLEDGEIPEAGGATSLHDHPLVKVDDLCE